MEEVLLNKCVCDKCDLMQRVLSGDMRIIAMDANDFDFDESSERDERKFTVWIEELHNDCLYRKHDIYISIYFRMNDRNCKLFEDLIEESKKGREELKNSSDKSFKELVRKENLWALRIVNELEGKKVVESRCPYFANHLISNFNKDEDSDCRA